MSESNASKIAWWRSENPGVVLTEALLCDLIGADLRGADLRNADLRYTELRYTELRHMDLRYADLIGADLRGVDLRYANLSYAKLQYADLRYANLPGSFPIATPSGEGRGVLTPDGLRLTIGCWHDKPVDDLRELLADKVEWPEAEGDERERRRPFLAAVLAQAEATENYYADYLVELAEKWKEER